MAAAWSFPMRQPRCDSPTNMLQNGYSGRLNLSPVSSITAFFQESG